MTQATKDKHEQFSVDEGVEKSVVIVGGRLGAKRRRLCTASGECH